eukprot:CAMPEP_0185796850 /NCGR_PEP_ID=MMETSP1174-20130828/161303_1 /TAXON_ID=35687 /ORGANISM="Dictyocha speculum, Strain CCMP1381" /LENGTH=152 /DNA_ID=CAMNT_0028492243 /DNA_START=614 /DNA_END=1070 /DNA_ORIENTATION=-
MVPVSANDSHHACLFIVHDCPELETEVLPVPALPSGSLDDPSRIMAQPPFRDYALKAHDSSSDVAHTPSGEKCISGGDDDSMFSRMTTALDLCEASERTPLDSTSARQISTLGASADRAMAPIVSKCEMPGMARAASSSAGLWGGEEGVRRA